MHQTRQAAPKRLPIQRKGMKYVARASSSLENSVPVIIAVRDILNLAKTKKEVKEMITQKLLKINWKIVMDYRESIYLFNLFQADKEYILKLSPTRKFFLEETKDGKERLCKVIGKKLLSGNKTQLNLHDGTNTLGDNKIKVGDSLYLDSSGKIKKYVSPEKGREVLVAAGRYEGENGKITEVLDKRVSIKFKEGSSILDLKNVFIL